MFINNKQKGRLELCHNVFRWSDKKQSKVTGKKPHLIPFFLFIFLYSSLFFTTYSKIIHKLIEPIQGVIVALTVGGLSGALSAYLGWNKSGEAFDSRKFVDGLVTGIVAGISLVMLNFANIRNATDDFELLSLMVTIFIGGLGADYAREKISGIIQKPKDPEPTPQPQPTPQ